MKRDKFAEKLYLYMEQRIIEICEKFRTGDYNDASFHAFRIGVIADIESFLKDKRLHILSDKDLNKQFESCVKIVELAVENKKQKRK